MKTNDKNLIVRKVGLSFSGFFGISAFTVLIYTAVKGVNFFDVVKHLSFTLSLLLSIVFFISSRFKGLRVKVVQTLCIVLSGFMALIFSSTLNSIHGEFMIVLGLWIGKIYGFFHKRIRYAIFGSTVLIIIVKFFIYLNEVKSAPITFIQFSTLLIFFVLVFYIIIDSESSRLVEEASVVSKQWSKEQVYNDIGRTVFSTFMHDYHTDHAVLHLETAEELLRSGDIQNAASIITGLKEMLAEDNKNILRIKEKIRMSASDEPERIDAVKIIIDKAECFRRSYNLSSNELKINFSQNEEFMLYVIPIDFVGVIENLLKNAIEASPKSVDVELKVEINTALCRLSITNTGMISWRDSNGCVPLESFRVGRTTKENGSGWGVYSIIRRIKDNLGSVQVFSKDGKTEFIITLPVKKKSKQKVIV